MPVLECSAAGINRSPLPPGGTNAILREDHAVVNRPELLRRFQAKFPGTTPRFLVRAPGRVNLIGEHTDYNDGFVLPIAMSQSLYVVAGAGEDDTIEACSTAFEQTARFPARDPGPPGETGWSSYVRGVAAMLSREGIALKPGRLLIDSEVPIGGGVSSSAALEIGTALALLSLAGTSLPPVHMALLGRRAEHEYARSPCGIMDQFICALGRAGHALLLDCRSHAYEHLPFPTENNLLLIMDTQVKHQIGQSQYPVRQQQCQQGLETLREAGVRADALRDVTLNDLAAVADRMDPLVARRCRHVVTEIARTLEAAEALRRRDLRAFGRLMFESHRSLRDDFEVSAPELDALVELASGVPDVYGARMTGGGFGGCAIALLSPSAEAALRNTVERQYNGRFDRPAIVYATTASDAAAVERL